MQDIHYVACNMISGTIQAVKFLLGKGHRIIGLINGPENLFATKEREDGFIQALHKNRLKFDPTLVVNTDLSLPSNNDAMQQLLSHKRRVTAVVVFNDYVALDVMHYANQKKVKINKDICFVSYANLPFTNYLKYCPLASVEQYPYQQGRKAAETLLELIEKKDDDSIITANYKVILDSQLVINKSS